MQEKTNPQASTLPRPLRMFYGVGEFGQQLSVLTLNLYLLYFYTNVLGISGKAAGILMLVARIWDAINDPMMGMIIDNTHSKHGKCRPYLLYCAVPAGLFLFLTFFAPNLSNTGKLVWAYVTYIGQGMLYTATGISYTSLMSRISDKPMDRVALNQSRAFISMFAAIVISSLTLKLIEGVGGGNERLGFAVIVGVYGVLQALCYLTVFRLTRGHDRPEPKAPAAEGGKGAGGREMLQSFVYILKNPLWRWLALGTMLYYTSSAITQGIVVYYVKFYLEKPALTGLATMCSMVSSFLAIVLLQVFAKKLGKARSCAMGIAIALCCLLVRLITRDSIFPLYLCCLLVSGFGLGLFSSLLVPSLMDSIDYGEWLFGKRNDALVMSANSFGNKLGSGVGAALLGFMLDAVGYDETLTIQSAAVKSGLFNTAIFVPLTVFAIVFCLMLVYRQYEKKLPQVRAELADKRAAAAAAAEAGE